MSAISRRAAGLAAVLLCAEVLAGCAAPASESAAGPTPEPESSAASTTLDANRREPIDPEYLTQLAVAAERAANYWQTVLDENAIRYITTRVPSWPSIPMLRMVFSTPLLTMPSPPRNCWPFWYMW